MYFTGAAGSARACTSIVEVDGPGIDVPAIPQFPRSAPVLVTAVAQWSDAAAAYVTAEYVARPLGAIRVASAGSFRILASATPNPNYPTVIDEAVARLFSYRESYKPRRNTSELSGRERAVYHGHDDEKRCSRIAPLRPHTGGVDGREARCGHLSQPGMASAQSRVQGGCGRSVSTLRRGGV